MDESLILWEVVERHLDDAEFLFEMWERAVVAPDASWRDVERVFGGRLRANLDGLAVSGEAGARRLLWPVLADAGAEQPRVAASTLALLGTSGPEVVGRVLRALAAAPAASALRAGLLRSLEVSDRPDLDDALRAELPTSPGDLQAALLGVLAERGADPGPTVGALLYAGNPAVQAAAARASAARPPVDVWPALAPLLDAEDALLRLGAIEAALTWGVGAGWERCVAQAGLGDRAAIEWVGMLGGEDDVRLLCACTSREETRWPALQALGLSGWRSAAEECLRWIGDENHRTARLAAEAFGAITGVDAYAEGFGVKDTRNDDEPPGLAEDLATPLTQAIEDSLPVPRSEAFLGWWKAHRGSFLQGERYLRGERYEAATVERQFRSGPMRRWRTLRAEVRVRSRGAMLLPRPRLTEVWEWPTLTARRGWAEFTRTPQWR